jgi:hypothetical protein
MADDATVEGSMLDGVVEGADAVRSVVLTIRSLYEDQEFKFAGAYGDDGFLEDYVAKVNGEPIGCVVLVTRNAAGQTQHVVASYRPRSRRQSAHHEGNGKGGSRCRLVRSGHDSHRRAP